MNAIVSFDIIAPSGMVQCLADGESHPVLDWQPPRNYNI